MIRIHEEKGSFQPGNAACCPNYRWVVPFPTAIFYTFSPVKGSQPVIGGGKASDPHGVRHVNDNATPVPNRYNRTLALPAKICLTLTSQRAVSTYADRSSAARRRGPLATGCRGCETLAIRYTTACQHADLAGCWLSASGMPRLGSRPNWRNLRPQWQQRIEVTNKDSGKTSRAFPRLLFLTCGEPHIRHFIGSSSRPELPESRD
jgi:hypothetical protein